MLEDKASILVVDDTPANLTLMVGLLRDIYHVRASTSGESALKIAYSDNPPDLILLDIMMPDMDGYEVCRRLKADKKSSHIPVIFLTAMSEIEDEEKGLKLGAVDYITKPVSPPIALVRIENHIKMHRQKKALIESQQMLAAELNEAADYILSTLPAELDGTVATKWKYIPSSSLGGDAFGYHWIDSDNLAIYLLDVCGHGVGSALMSVSAINALRTQSLMSTDFKKPALVLGAINNAFLMEDHDNKFFTMWYGVYNRISHSLNYSSAAHPPAFLLTGDTADKSELKELSTANMPIGFMKDTTFNEATVTLNKMNKLYVYSDGVYEIEKSDGEMLTLAEFTEVIRNISKVNSLQAEEVLLAMNKLKATNGPFEDDFSFIELIINQQ